MTNLDIYIGKTNNVCSYSTYLDGAVPYTFTYATPWLDYGQEFNQKILKNFYLLSEAGSESNVGISWAVDFKETYNSTSKTSESGPFSEYNVAEFGIGEFGYGYRITTMQGPMSKAGKVVKFKISVPIEGVFNIKKYEIYAKVGRVI